MKTGKTCDKSKFRNFAISCAVLLTGCTSAPPASIRVEVPVMVPCSGEVPERLVYEFDRLPVGATEGEVILALARDWVRGRGYEGKLEAVIAGVSNYSLNTCSHDMHLKLFRIKVSTAFPALPPTTAPVVNPINAPVVAPNAAPAAMPMGPATIPTAARCSSQKWSKSCRRATS